MKRKQLHNLLLILFLVSFFSEIWIVHLTETSELERLSVETVTSMNFRDQEIGEEMLEYISVQKNPAQKVGLYLLESKFGYQKFNDSFSDNSFERLYKKWKKCDGWHMYLKYTEAVWDDVKYFPVPESTIDKNLQVTFSNGWMSERTYGGKRGHEGTDIMASQNTAGLYPIVSMTDGVVTKKGWLEKGGYRIGVEAPSGAYFYYAHLDSYAELEIGDAVKAGDLLGFMGDSGYGAEGTTGMFSVHLHVGIYIYPEEELSVNPYWVLRYLENRKVKCAYSSGDIG